MLQLITAESGEYVRLYVEVNGPADLNSAERSLLDHYIRTVAKQGCAVVRETVQATSNLTGIGLNRLRKLRSNLAAKGRITIRQTGRATEITLIDIRPLPFGEPVEDTAYSEPLPSWSPFTAQQIVSYVERDLLAIDFPALTAAVRPALTDPGEPSRFKEEIPPTPPKEETFLDSSNLESSGAQQATAVEPNTAEPGKCEKRKKRQSKPSAPKAPRPVQPHIAIIDAWYNASDPRYRPASLTYSRFLRMGKALKQAGITPGEVTLYIEKNQASYQEWALPLQSRTDPKPPPMIMSLEYLNAHLPAWVTEYRRIEALKIRRELEAAEDQRKIDAITELLNRETAEHYGPIVADILAA